jgi:hypothetical protein
MNSSIDETKFKEKTQRNIELQNVDMIESMSKNDFGKQIMLEQLQSHLGRDKLYSLTTSHTAQMSTCK